jgi:hypothetical protein
MNIEELIQQNTKALIENTAALREILSVGAATAADTLVPAAPKKRAAKTTEPTPAQAEAREKIQEVLDQDPPITASTVEETPAPEPEPEPETSQVPDLPVAELRAKLKEEIKGKLLADTEGTVKATFDALRAKYGVSVIKELTDDQVGAFYAEVLTWG